MLTLICPYGVDVKHPDLFKTTQTNRVLRKWSTNTQTRWIYGSIKRHGVNINIT